MIHIMMFSTHHVMGGVKVMDSVAGAIMAGGRMIGPAQPVPSTCTVARHRVHETRSDMLARLPSTYGDMEAMQGRRGVKPW